MTKNELLDVMTMIVMSYPERFKEESVPGMVTAWYAFFKDDDANAVKLAVTKHIACNKWPPSIAEIREVMVTFQHPELMPPDAAWTLVADQLEGTVYTSFGWFGDEDFQKAFPPLVAEVVSSIGWSKLRDMSRGQSAGYRNGQDRQTFLDHYTPAYNRAREMAMLPKSLRSTVDQITAKSPIPRMIAEAQQSKKDVQDYWNRYTGANLLTDNTSMNGESENELY